jgi:hypothetical protein
MRSGNEERKNEREKESQEGMEVEDNSGRLNAASLDGLSQWLRRSGRVPWERKVKSQNLFCRCRKSKIESVLKRLT